MHPEARAVDSPAAVQCLTGLPLLVEDRTVGIHALELGDRIAAVGILELEDLVRAALCWMLALRVAGVQ